MKSAHLLAYERTSTARARRRATLRGNLLAGALILASLTLTCCTIMGRG